MNPTDSLDGIYRRFIAEEGRIENEIDALELQVKSLKDRLEDLRTLRQDTEHLLRERGLFPVLNAGAPAAAAPQAAPAAARPATKPAPQEPAAPPQKTSAATKAGAAKMPSSDGEAPAGTSAKTPARERKGRRKNTQKRLPRKQRSGINQYGIVDAAVELAKKHGVREADAGMVLDWFVQEGYETRNGPPTRNSIYVSLNREHHEGQKGKKVKVRRTGERGQFIFDIDEQKTSAAEGATKSSPTTGGQGK